MLWNVRDRRSNKYCVDIDAVFEPGFHDNSIKDSSQAEEDDSWTIASEYNTTIDAAVSRAMNDWDTPVTLYLYDAGSDPIGKIKTSSK